MLSNGFTAMQHESSSKVSTPLPSTPTQVRPELDQPVLLHTSVLGLQATVGNQAVQRLIAAGGAVQRTLAGAKAYASRDNDLNMYTIKSKDDVEALLVNTDVPAGKRQKLKEAYNKGLNEADQITTAVTQAAVNNATVVDQNNYYTFWSAGGYGPPKDNADGHFQKHVQSQGEFSGKFQSVVEYTADALAFSKVTGEGILEEVQKAGNYGKYQYDVQAKRGRMVVLNGQNGRLTSYYELRGTPQETAEYIKEKMGLASAQEVLGKLRELSGGQPAQQGMSGISMQMASTTHMSSQAPTQQQPTPSQGQTTNWQYLDQVFVNAPSGSFTLDALRRYFADDIVAGLWDPQANQKLRNATFHDKANGTWKLINSSYPYQVMLARVS